jgi:hypothetical protein
MFGGSYTIEPCEHIMRIIGSLADGAILMSTFLPPLARYFRHESR